MLYVTLQGHLLAYVVLRCSDSFSISVLSQCFVIPTSCTFCMFTNRFFVLFALPSLCSLYSYRRDEWLLCRLWFVRHLLDLYQNREHGACRGCVLFLLYGVLAVHSVHVPCQRAHRPCVRHRHQPGSNPVGISAHLPATLLHSRYQR